MNKLQKLKNLDKALFPKSAKIMSFIKKEAEKQKGLLLKTKKIEVIKKLLSKERGLSEYKLKGKPLTDVYGTPIVVQDTSGIDDSIWIRIEDPKQAVFDKCSGHNITPFFRLNNKKAKQLVAILEFYINQ